MILLQASRLGIGQGIAEWFCWLGEGAGVVVLEEYEHHRDRRCKRWSEIFMVTFGKVMVWISDASSLSTAPASKDHY